MDSTLTLHPNPAGWLEHSELAQYVGAYERYLAQRGYCRYSIQTYIYCIAHFAHWMTDRGLGVRHVSEDALQNFLGEHLPQCDCPEPVRRSRHELRAAIIHLLRVMRQNSPLFPAQLRTPVDEELLRFDAYMLNVHGFAWNTRNQRKQIVRRFLTQRFSDRVVISAIAPDDVRRFLATELRRWSAASCHVLAGALRGYFRFRTTAGDDISALVAAVASPANWRLASLPSTLTESEVERLLATLTLDGPSPRRACAMVRCAVDIGLRAREVAFLGLDDIDWRSGTVTVAGGKSRRSDVLPLPFATGHAIAEYLRFERPATVNRALFVRHVAPRDEPIGPGVVRRAIHEAFRRSGLPDTRAHVLRHTLASRIQERGGSLKEIADLLRHRSLDTALIYTKLDTKRLLAVALPWPGSSS